MAVSFNSATPDWINLGTSLSALNNTTEATVSLWANAVTLSRFNFASISIGPPPGTTAIDRLSLECAPDGSLTLLAKSTDGTGSKTVTSAAASMPTGVWTHLVGVVKFALTSNNIILYKNGAQLAIASDTFVGGVTSNTDSKVGALGAQCDGSDFFMNGALEDVRIYNVALTPEEIGTIYETRGPDGILRGLKNRFLLNEGRAGSTVPTTVGLLKDVGPLAITSLAAVGTPTFASEYVRFRRRQTVA